MRALLAYAPCFSTADHSMGGGRGLVSALLAVTFAQQCPPLAGGAGGAGEQRRARPACSAAAAFCGPLQACRLRLPTAAASAPAQGYTCPAVFRVGRARSRAVTSAVGSARGAEAAAAETASVAALEYSETEAYLVGYVGVSAEHLDKLMNSKPFPNLHTKSLDADIRPCIQFLLDEVGMPRESLGKALVTCPQLLGVGVGSLRTGLDFLRGLGIPHPRVATLVQRFPHILKYSVETNLRPSADFLRREVGLSDGELQQLVEKEPGCLQLSVACNLMPTCGYLLEDLGLSRQQLRTLVSKNPRVLSMSLRSNLMPKVQWMLDIGVPTSKLAALLVSYPLLISFSLPKLREGEAVLVQNLGVAAEGLGGIMVKCPQLFGLRAEQIERKAGVIASELGLTREQLSTLTERYPRVLTYSLPDNLLPKIQYLAREMEFELADLSLEIVEYPLILGYSLEKRIKARHEHLAKCNVLVRPRSVKRAVRSAAKVRQGGDADGAGPRGTDGDGAQDTRAGGVAPEARGTRVIGLRSMLSMLPLSVLACA